jgi:3-oxoacyl-[acyl-carrier-protein] synthase II
MQRSPVWIAGLGVVSAAGGNVRKTLASFAEGVANPSADLPFESGISCPTFQVHEDLPALAGRFNQSRSLRLAMKAVREAMEDAGISGFDGARVGVAIGTTVASQLNNIPFYDAYRRNLNPSLDPILEYLSANLAHGVGEILGVAGPRLTIVNACSSGTDALGAAKHWIDAGLCDIAIAGGADELNRVAIAGFWSLGVTSTQPCAPFDRDRAGLNLGEGAGILILESDAHLRQRSGKATFQIAGFGAACDAHHLTAPHPEGRGLHAAITTALGQAGVSAKQVSFINAHGTATADNDRAEGKVLERIFGPAVQFLSTKGYTGHTLGAAGGLEAGFTLLGLRETWIPKSAGFASKADDIPITPVNRRSGVSGEYAMSTSLAFGGNNSAVLIRRIA